MVRRNISALAILIVAITCIWNSLNETRWVTNGIVVWDAACYYAYLPETFNQRGDSLTGDQVPMPGLRPVNLHVIAPNGNKVIKTTMGLSILYAPFYAIGYAAHYLRTGDSGNGLEIEYRIAMEYFGICCLLVSLCLLRLLLRQFFRDEIVAATLLLLALGTNVFYYTQYEGCMSHVPNMMLFTLFILLTQKWYVKPNVVRSVILGALMGLIVLIRPTNILLGLFFLLYDITSLNGIKERIILLFSKWHLVLMMGAAAFLIWVPQMLYWHKLTGQFYFYSYLGERFFFLDPHIFYGMLGGRKGWLLYTPLGIFMLLGFFVMRRYVKSMFLASLVFYLLFVYVIFSWWCWWYGGSFSCRAMIDSYAVLALPLASFLQFVFYGDWWKTVKAVFGLLLVFLLGLNLFQTYQYKYEMIHFSHMTYAAYKYVFLKLRRPPKSLLKDAPDQAAREGKKYSE